MAIKGSPEKFVLDIKNYRDDVKKAVKTTNQVVALESHARLKRENPKDIVWSANNWNMAIGEADLALRPGKRPKKKMKLVPADSDTARKIDYNSVVFITNNTPYVIYLEDGTTRSTQAQPGWFERTARVAFKRYQKILNDQIRRGVK